MANSHRLHLTLMWLTYWRSFILGKLWWNLPCKAFCTFSVPWMTKRTLLHTSISDNSTCILIKNPHFTIFIPSFDKKLCCSFHKYISITSFKLWQSSMVCPYCGVNIAFHLNHSCPKSFFFILYILLIIQDRQQRQLLPRLDGLGFLFRSGKAILHCRNGLFHFEPICLFKQ